MSAEDVVDISDSPTDRRNRLFWLRVGVPIGGVALVIIAILSITLYADRVNRAGVLGLSGDVLDAMQDRIQLEMTSYFEPATRATRLARDIVARNVITDPRAALEAFASSALRQIPQINALYSGDAHGNFMMVQRGAAGGTNTKLIVNTPGARMVQWIHHDAQGSITGRDSDPEDNFDPRTRVWYQGALKTNDVYWSDVYVFFTDKTPGVTASIRFRDTDTGERVFGVDITLKALSGFLASLKIGATGRAVIVDDTGHLVAAPDARKVLQDNGGQLVTARIDQFNDPALLAAYDRFRVEGYGRRIIPVNGTQIVSIVAPLPSVGRNWALLLVVPESDFTGFVASNGRKTLMLSLVVVLLTALLAALLVRQGLRADRTARALLERGRAVEQQSVALVNLARQANLFDPMQEAPMRTLAEILAGLGSARRASIWRILANRRALYCGDAYEPASGGHSGGFQLMRTELPQFFAALETGDALEIGDAADDPRGAEFHRVLMHPIDTRKLHVIPVRGTEHVLGAVILEDGAWPADTRDFLVLVANMLAIRFGNAVEPATGHVDEAEAGPAASSERSFAADLALRGLASPAIGAEVFPRIAVMVIKLADPAAMAMRNDTDSSVLVDRIAAALQDIADAHAIPYMKISGHDVIAAAGFASDDQTAIIRIADAAVAARDHCLELFEAMGPRPSFRIGLDYGIAIGSQVGRQPRLFNLWGDAVRTADAMAASGAAPGAIQVSEAAYQHLRQHFLFRPRGNFYLPHLGATHTFVLGGRP